MVLVAHQRIVSVGKKRARTQSPSNPTTDDVAPSGHIRAHSECEKQVFRELFERGKGTAQQVANRLAKRGIDFTVVEVQTALDGWIARGWVAVTAGKAHLSGDAIAYLR